MLLSAREAVQRLGVKPATLYAYVSRGLLRSAPGTDSRAKRYYAEDVERLRRQKHAGPRTAKPPKPFETRVPMLDTSLCLIDGGRLYYRGVEATVLAETSDLETIAHLLWGHGDKSAFDAGLLSDEVRSLLSPAHPQPLAAPMDRARELLARLAGHDIAALETVPTTVARTGARLVAALAAAVTGRMPGNGPIHQQLARAWKLDAAGGELVRRCLVLTADHELNASTYVARCIASTGASPYAVVLGALGALSGPRHGGETSRVEALLREVSRTGDVPGAVAERLQRGERIPGFGQPLYPHGDPRGRHLLEAVKASRHGRDSRKILAIGDEIASLIGRHPNVDFALGLISLVLKLPPRSGLGLFLIGRSVGWIAHAIEQYATGQLIRPRARYVGLLPMSA